MVKAKDKKNTNPKAFYSWNVNGLVQRVNKKNLEAFYSEIKDRRPDVVSLQEIRLSCHKGDASMVLKGGEDEKTWEAFMKPLRDTYQEYLSLADRRYGGQAMSIKKTMAGHHPDGRVIKAEFQELQIKSVYAPFNGTGKPHLLERRRKWDASLRREMIVTKGEKPRILLGDLNTALDDKDKTSNNKFWFNQGLGKEQRSKAVELCMGKEPGVYDVAIGDQGFGGTTANERQDEGMGGGLGYVRPSPVYLQVS
jgi:exonuclease III